METNRIAGNSGRSFISCCVLQPFAHEYSQFAFPVELMGCLRYSNGFAGAHQGGLRWPNEKWHSVPLFDLQTHRLEMPGVIASNGNKVVRVEDGSKQVRCVLRDPRGLCSAICGQEIGQLLQYRQ